ncbi:MAG: hypothetical protein ABGY96_28185 [bacterium]|nr:hypothetical protein [Gammaproteobacteria bacterium]HIL94623.1 hypothetical protein [Pseudomonadales bacterium]
MDSSYSQRALNESWDLLLAHNTFNYLLPGVRMEGGGANVGSDISLLRGYSKFGYIKTFAERHRLVARAEFGIALVSDRRDPVPGDHVFGLGDLLHASCYTPASSGNFVWGLGAMLSIPTATDDKSGSGKWVGRARVPPDLLNRTVEFRRLWWAELVVRG